MQYDVIIVGAGFAGSVMAERLATLNKKVLVIDERNHLGGNAYDYLDSGIIVHKYGPHLFHTNDEKVFNYIKKFGNWFKYEHRVLGKVNNQLVPIPFNLTSIEKCFDSKKSDKLKNILVTNFGKEKKISILDLKKYNDNDINLLANFIYENVFLYYTMKQWGKKPNEIDASVISRVPVFISRDDRYFQDKYQIMPEEGYSKVFEKMLSSKNITISLNTKASDVIEIKENKIYYQQEEFKGIFIYTGMVDELLNYKYGKLEYRTLDFEIEKLNQNSFQPVGTVNYPTKEDKFTRITEFKHMMKSSNTSNTIIMKEYPREYLGGNDIPYYPINNDKNNQIYQNYCNELSSISNFYLLGRLAEYKYYNMDAIIKEALILFDKLEGEI